MPSKRLGPTSRKPCWKDCRGTVQKYLKEVTLLAQVFVKAEDGKQTVEQLLKQKGASVAGFTLYVVGEGIEKKVSDFRRRSGRPGPQPPRSKQGDHDDGFSPL